MNPKKIATGALLAFVALSMVYLIVKEIRTPEPVAEKQLSNETNTTDNSSSNTAECANTVVAYYFYGNVRCQTCRKLEAYTSESIRTTFTNELADGRLQWRTVNTDEKENEHFVKDYELTSRSVVLVEMVDGQQSRWKDLVQIWDLVGDKEQFQKYIADETTAFLSGGSM